MISTETLERPPSESSPSGGEFERKGSRLWKAGAAILVIAAGAFIFWPRRSQAKSEEVNGTVPIVAAARVSREEIARELVFDSELRPYQEVDLHAKVAGYVEAIHVDVGDHVKEGQLIAELELPEVKDDLERAVAAQRRAAQQIKRAQAAWEDAHLVLTRMADVEKVQPNLIAQQEIDSARARERTAEADLAAAKEQENASAAEVKKLNTMLQYAKITAPFEGVITRRYADKGALIQAGTSSSTQAMPVVRLSQNGFLRLVFPVSASWVPDIKEGAPVEISVPGLNRTMQAKISRSTQKLDFSTRTMESEVDIENPDFSLIPGMYASVRLKVDRKPNALVAPVRTVARRAGDATVYVIGKDGIIQQKHVQLGLETPFKVEILSGVNEGDLLFVGNRSDVKPGQRVTAKMISLGTEAPKI